tara:strand:- start:226 stop:1023 length:798 start_codon:yes stop_codon:yes gene_type:complete
MKLLVFVIICCCLLLYLKKTKTQTRIPKIVYVFWEGKSNLLVDICLSSLYKMNPTWKIVVLNSSNIQKTKGYESLGVRHKSDWARVSKLESTGGVWIDITCIHRYPLESWVNLDSFKLQGFSFKGDSNLMENWAFAVPPKFPLMTAWKYEYKHAIRIGFEKYNHLYSNKTPKILINWLPYLTQHQSLHIARLKTPKCQIHLVPCNDPLHGPLYPAFECNFDANTLINYIYYKNLHYIPFIKLSTSDFNNHINDERLLQIQNNLLN